MACRCIYQEARVNFIKVSVCFNVTENVKLFYKQYTKIY